MAGEDLIRWLGGGDDLIKEQRNWGCSHVGQAGSAPTHNPSDYSTTNGIKARWNTDRCYPGCWKPSLHEAR